MISQNFRVKYEAEKKNSIKLIIKNQVYRSISYLSKFLQYWIMRSENVLKHSEINKNFKILFQYDILELVRDFLLTNWEVACKDYQLLSGEVLLLEQSINE